MVAVFVPVLSKANCSGYSWRRPEREGWDRPSLHTKKNVAQHFITLLAK